MNREPASRRRAARQRGTAEDRQRGTAQERQIALPTDVQWRRVHPITPLLEGWKVITAILAFTVYQNLQAVTKAYEALQDTEAATVSRVLPWVLAGVAAVLVMLGIGLWLSWRMRTYAVDRDAVYLRTGVLNKQLRTARLPRIQSVDVVHPLLGRIFGLGRLTVEVAGGGDSRVSIGFLRSRDLAALRDQILSLAAGQEVQGDVVVGVGGGDAVTPGVAGDGVASTGGGVAGAGTGAAAGALPLDAAPGYGRAPGQDIGVVAAGGADGAAGAGVAGSGASGGAGAVVPRGFEDAVAAKRRLPGALIEAHEHDLYEVDTKVLICSMLRSGATISAVVILVASLGLAVIGFIAADHAGKELGTAAGISALMSVLAVPLGIGSYAWSGFDKGWRFRAAATPAGIRMRYGLTSETSSTLPPGRVHGVKLSQGPFWRGPDWWRAEVSVAGRLHVEAKSNQGELVGANVLLPVGERDIALRALWLVVPDLGVADPDGFLAAALGDGRADGAATASGGVLATGPVGVADAAAAVQCGEAGAGASGAGGSAGYGVVASSVAPAAQHSGTGGRFLGISPRGRVFSPIAWRREGIALTDTCVVVRKGRLWRRTSVIPYERVQSLHVTQGPFARRRGLAAIRLDMVDGEMARSLSNLSLADAAFVTRVVSERALVRRSGERLDRWLARATA